MGNLFQNINTYRCLPDIPINQITSLIKLNTLLQLHPLTEPDSSINEQNERSIQNPAEWKARNRPFIIQYVFF